MKHIIVDEFVDSHKARLSLVVDDPLFERLRRQRARQKKTILKLAFIYN